MEPLRPRIRSHSTHKKLPAPVLVEHSADQIFCKDIHVTSIEQPQPRMRVIHPPATTATGPLGVVSIVWIHQSTCFVESDAVWRFLALGPLEIWYVARSTRQYT